MKIEKAYPPNIEIIRAANLAKEGNIYCYGDTIYNPQGGEIPEDIIFHEEVHSKQQGNDPYGWWNKYITDKDFRKDQEVEAYNKQYRLIKTQLGDKASKDFLEEFAHNLSTLYNLDINIHQASTLIRKYNNN